MIFLENIFQFLWCCEEKLYNIFWCKIHKIHLIQEKNKNISTFLPIFLFIINLCYHFQCISNNITCYNRFKVNFKLLFKNYVFKLIHIWYTNGKRQNKIFKYKDISQFARYWYNIESKSIQAYILSCLYQQTKKHEHHNSSVLSIFIILLCVVGERGCFYIFVYIL